jgi:hypothetical protein
MKLSKYLKESDDEREKFFSCGLKWLSDGARAECIKNPDYYNKIDSAPLTFDLDKLCSEQNDFMCSVETPKYIYLLEKWIDSCKDGFEQKYGSFSTDKFIKKMSERFKKIAKYISYVDFDDIFYTEKYGESDGDWSIIRFIKKNMNESKYKISDDYDLEHAKKEFDDRIKQGTASGLKSPQFSIIQKKLESEFPGSIVATVAYDEDTDNYIKRGIIFNYSKVLKIRCDKNLTSQCHYISTQFQKINPTLKIATGYALSKDGIWRQHTWVWDNINYIIYEPTEKRIEYFGFIMNKKEANKFYWDNS